jgi:hypothetical protein
MAFLNALSIFPFKCGYNEHWLVDLQVLLLMRNLSTNLTSPDLEEHVSSFICSFLRYAHISLKSHSF